MNYLITIILLGTTVHIQMVSHRQLIKILTGLICLGGLSMDSMYAQVLNGDTYNYEIQYANMCAHVDDESLQSEEWTLLLTAQPNGEQRVPACFMETGVDEDCVPNRDRDILYEPSNSNLVTLFFLSWEDDGDPTCSFEGGIDDLFGFAEADIELSGLTNGPLHNSSALTPFKMSIFSGTTLTTDVFYYVNWR